jgi:Tol biopolymer transport system component
VFGRFVAFESAATNLVAGDTNGVVRDIFVHDRDTDDDGVFDEPGAVSTVKVSVSSSGIQGNNASSAPSISAFGRFVAFESTANNLISSDANGTVKDIFIHDRDIDDDGIYDEPGAVSTVIVSASSSGTQGNNASSAPSISPDGAYVVFESAASNLVAGDTNGFQDIFVNGP